MLSLVWHGARQARNNEGIEYHRGEVTPIPALEIHLLIAGCAPSTLPGDARIQHLENRLCELLLGATRALYFYKVPVMLGCCVTFSGEK